MDWDQIAEEYLAAAQEVFSDLRDPVDAVASLMTRCLQGGGKILICGNGGSAADAQHFAGELVNRFLKDSKPYAAVALTTDTSVLTSIGNDYGYEEIFAKQVQALGREGDVLVAISTSGTAGNILKAVSAAKACKMTTVGMTGGTGGKLASAVDHAVCVSSTTSVPRIQEAHGLIIHALCEQIEEDLG